MQLNIKLSIMAHSEKIKSFLENSTVHQIQTLQKIEFYYYQLIIHKFWKIYTLGIFLKLTAKPSKILLKIILILIVLHFYQREVSKDY